MKTSETSINLLFGAIAVSRAHSFLVYQLRYASSFVARLLALYPKNQISKGFLIYRKDVNGMNDSRGNAFVL